MTWKYHNPVRIVFADAFDEAIGSIADGKDGVLLMCSNRFRETEDFKKITHSLAAFRCFSEIENNPSFDSCQQAIDFARDSQPKMIVAIGGGSVIDTAKAARMAIYKSCYDIHKVADCQVESNEKPLLVAVPTTHGAGSELTMWATVWDKKEKKKHSLSESDNYPDCAIYDPNLTVSLPLSVSVSSTLDALSHSLEAVWNKNANPVSSHFAAKAIALIVSNLEKIVEPISIETRINLLLAAMYSGLAFSNTKTAAAHSISYPLTAYFGIPHGIACSMPLNSLFKLNAMQMQDVWPQFLSKARINDFDDIWEKVLGLTEMGPSFNLRGYGIERDDLDWLTDMAFSKGRMENNIIDLNRNDVSQILADIY